MQKERENNSQNKYECEKEDKEIDDQSEGVIRAFVNNKLRIANRKFNFQQKHQEDASRIFFNEEIKQAIVRNEVI